MLDRVCELRFRVEKAEDSEGDPEEDFFALPDADKEGMFSRKLSEVGEDWIIAVAQLTKLSGKRVHYREIIKMQSRIDRKTEMLLDIRIKCLKTTLDNAEKKKLKLAACWKQIQEKIKWLSYEYIDDQPEIKEIQNICEALIRNGQLEQEAWGVRWKVLKDIIRNEYYDYYSCGDVMEELAEKLCINREEYLACADIMDATDQYRERAEYLYHEYGKDDKYVSYLEEHLGRKSKDYSSLITYYQEHGRQGDACRVAQLGLERCKEDLTGCFICLLSDARKKGEQKQYQKLYASAKRRKNTDVEKIKYPFWRLSIFQTDTCTNFVWITRCTVEIATGRTIRVEGEQQI